MYVTGGYGIRPYGSLLVSVSLTEIPLTHSPPPDVVGSPLPEGAFSWYIRPPTDIPWGDRCTLRADMESAPTGICEISSADGYNG